MHTLDSVHDLGMVYNDLSNLKIFLLDREKELVEQRQNTSSQSEAGRGSYRFTYQPGLRDKRKAEDNDDVPYITGLLRMQEAKHTKEKEKERMEFRSYLLQGKKPRRRDTSYMLSFGPFELCQIRKTRGDFCADDWLDASRTHAWCPLFGWTKVCHRSLAVGGIPNAKWYEELHWTLGDEDEACGRQMHAILRFTSFGGQQRSFKRIFSWQYRTNQ